MFTSKDLTGITAIVGGRQSGKTSWLHKILADFPKASHILFTRENQRMKMVGDTHLSFQSITEKKFLLLDDLFGFEKNKELDEFIYELVLNESFSKFASIMITFQTEEQIPHFMLVDSILYLSKNGTRIVDDAIENGYVVLYNKARNEYKFANSFHNNELTNHDLHSEIQRKFKQENDWESKQNQIPRFNLLDLKGITVIVGKRESGKTGLLGKLLERKNSLYVLSGSSTLEKLLDYDHILIDNYDLSMRGLLLLYLQIKKYQANIIIAVQYTHSLPVYVKYNADYYLYTSETSDRNSKFVNEHVTFEHKVLHDVHHDKYFIIDS